MFTFGEGYILQRLMTSSESLTSAGTESRAHASNLIALSRCIFGHSGLTIAKVDVHALLITRQVSDVDVSCHPYVLFLTCGALKR